MSAAFVALAASAGLAASAQAATYTVGTQSDTTGTCGNPSGGGCSLRQLIDYEDELPETPNPSDVIIVPAGNYELTNGSLYIDRALAILGAGARTTTVKVSPGAERPARVFEVQAPGSETVGMLGLKIAGGSTNNFDETYGEYGGDIRNKGSLLLSEDWITEGVAGAGAGIANDAGTLVLERSLVSGNHARTDTAEAGAIQNYGSANCESTCPSPGTKAVLALRNSTVAENDASVGAGILSATEDRVADGNLVSIIDSTIVHNSTQEEPCTECFARSPGAGLLAEEGTVDVIGSIVAENTETTVANGTTTTNCSAIEPATISSLGYNLENGSDCAFKATGDKQSTAPDFSPNALQDNGGNTNTFALASTSPAVDAIPTSFSSCEETDQRGVSRPQGAGCDIGAYEFGAAASTPPPPPPPAPPTLLATAPPSVISTTSAAFTTTVNPHGLATTVHFEYGPVLPGAKTAAITYGSSTPSQAVGADFANHTVTVTVQGLLPNVAYHVRAVASNSLGTVQGVDQVLQTPADPPPPPPVLGKSVNVAPVSGLVLIELPPAAHASFAAPLTTAIESLSKGIGFIPLTEARQIPVGSILDTTGGVVSLTTATVAAKHGKLQFGDFGAGLFKLLQGRKQRGLTDLDIMDAHSARQVCATVGKAHTAAKHLSSKVLGRLNASAHGKFTTRGQYSAATVRGTVWKVINQCNGTLTKVTRGVVSVRDFRRRKTITLFTGQHYLARAPR